MSAPKAATNILRLTTSNIMKHIYLVPALLSALALTACTDDDNLDVHLPEAEYGTPNGTMPEENSVRQAFSLHMPIVRLLRLLMMLVSH